MNKAIQNNITKTFIAILLNIILLGLFVFLFARLTKPLFIASLISILISIFTNIVLFFASNRILLHINDCKKIDEKSNLNLVNKVTTLSKRIGINTPKLYTINEKSINSLSIGNNSNNSAIIITQGAINNLSNNELDYLISYELIKILKKETEFYTVSVCTLGLIALFSDSFFRSVFKSMQKRGKESESFMRLLLTTFFFIFAPLSVKTIELFVSKKNKLQNDEFCKEFDIPVFSMISTLNKINNTNVTNAMYSRACNNMFFANPLIGQKVSKNFSAHIPLNEKIEYINSLK